MKRCYSIPALAIVLLSSALLAQAAAVSNSRRALWGEILGPAQGTVPPPPEFKVAWRTDLQSALAEAKAKQRPLFVTLRCLPCKQCAEFDKEVLDGGSELDPLLAQFITVRLTNAAAIDLRIFPVEGYQDLDLSWWGWFLSPEAQVYAIFGGKDHVSEKTRISKAALIATAWRVLKHHYDPRRKDWNIDGPAPDLKGEVVSLAKLPGWTSWDGKRSTRERQGCVHCHEVNDILRQPAIDAHTFDKKRDVNVWPLPENIGIELDRDHGLRVKSVQSNSPAANAGIQTGDELGAAGGRKLFGQADLRGALQRGPREAGQLELVWSHDGKVNSGELALTNGWRKTILDWRMSISQGNIGGYPGFFPLAINAARRQQLKIPSDGMALEPYMGRNTNNPPYKAGIRGRDVVTAVNQQSPNVAGRAFLVWFRQQYDPGDEVTMTIRNDKGESRDVTYRLPIR